MPENREIHPAPAAINRNGERVCSPDPYQQPGAADSTVRNFGRPYEPQQPKAS